MNSKDIAHESEIRLTVGLDQHRNPIRLSWTAEEGGIEPNREVKAFFLTTWDKKENNSMRMDLWTTEFMVDEMQTLVFQHLMSLADVVQRSTGDEVAAHEMRTFANQLHQTMKSREENL
ncbi:MAG: gliding motility protein GldC [Bacteroidetes bacterium]|jgi:gliding motility-associated protein GldC|nr:gliding motility protein GldC [Bacteroidota bacterium]